jgi:hypothetical protein
VTLTEEEAKTKWCPFVRHNLGRDLPAAYRGMHVTSDSKCIGSACMAWRDAGKDTRTNSYVGNYSVDVGFCGLAGKPT